MSNFLSGFTACVGCAVYPVLWHVVLGLYKHELPSLKHNNIFILTMSQTNVCCYYQSLLIVIYPPTFQFLWASWTLLASFSQSFRISEYSENLINIGLLCIWRLRHNSIYNDAFCLLNMYISWWCVHYDNTSTFFNSLFCCPKWLKWLTNAALMCINHAKQLKYVSSVNQVCVFIKISRQETIV